MMSVTSMAFSLSSSKIHLWQKGMKIKYLNALLLVVSFRYGIKTFPALVYFRNGNPLTFDGDLKSEESVLEWLIDDDNRELEDEIEAVNYRMLDKLLETSPLMAVFFCMYLKLE